MLSTAESVTQNHTPPYVTDRRFEPRQLVSADLWMIDHAGETVLRCRCIDVSESGLRLRVPLGYGVAEGQRYELRSHLPGAVSGGGFGVIARRKATVVRTQLHLGGGEDHLEVGVVLDPAENQEGNLAVTPSAIA